MRTESTRVQGDVYFGSDAGAINRDMRDAYDSSKTLTKVKNPHIADGNPIDWLSNMAQKMVRATNSLAGVDRELNNTKVNWASSVVDVGDKKEHKDLYHAWITSRMSKYTQNNMLKKALADSSFLGADIPTVASNVLTFGGIQVDAEQFSEDQQGWKEYMEFEKTCKEALNSAGARIQNEIKKFNDTVKDTSAWDFPKNCAEAYPVSSSYGASKFSKNIRAIYQACQNMDKDYQELENKCHLWVSRNSANCSSDIEGTYERHWNTFLSNCATEFAAYFQQWFQNDWWPANCSLYATDCNDSQERDNYFRDHTSDLRNGYISSGKWTQTDGKEYTQQKFVSSLKSDLTIYNDNNFAQNTMLNVVIDQNGGSSPYFPTEGKTEEEISTNVKGTVKDQMAENKTL